MILKILRVQNFRTHSDFILEIGEKSTLISGANGCLLYTSDAADE